MDDDTERRTAAGRNQLWRATATAATLRLGLFVGIGLTPLGALATAPLVWLPTRSDEHALVVGYVTGLLLQAVVGWLPRVATHRRRAAAYRTCPALRPMRPSPAAARRQREGRVLLATTLAMWLLAAVTGRGAILLLAAASVLILSAWAILARRSPAVSFVPEAGAARDADRLVAARDSLALPREIAAVDVLPGRIVGRGMNAFALRLRRRPVVVVAPELLAAMPDRQLRALLAHEFGHHYRGLTTRRLLDRALALAVLAASIFLPFLFLRLGWPPLPASKVQVGAQVAALQVTSGHLALVLLRPFVLLAMRSDEARADRAMVRWSRDPDGCAGLLDTLGRRLGTPRRWTFAQRLLVATHPAIDERLESVAKNVAVAPAAS